jgi:predicted ATPase
LVLPAIAHATGATRELATHLEHRRTLLVLDNFEQLVSAAPQVAHLLRAAPEVKILATSREPLHVSGEHEYPVLPLEERDAVALFVERACAVRPDFQATAAITQICSRLDCLPLAIELAAARTKLLSPQALLERLDARLPVLTGGPRDAPDRQRTLHATIEWSYKLLPQQEQLLFRRLAVFVGGFTLDAAERIAHADMDTLQSLIDKSLVRRRETEFGTRYWMLETIRDFAAERLDETTEHQRLGRAHAGFFAAFAGRFAEMRRRSEGANTRQLQNVRRLTEEMAAEHDNLRAALERSLDRAEPELATRLFVALHDFWIRMDYLVEGRRWAERILSDVSAVSPRLRGRAFYVAAQLAFFTDDVAAAGALYARSLEVAREHGDEPEVAWLLIRLASVDSARGDLLTARSKLEESLRVCRTTGDERSIGVALQYLGEVERDLGNTDRAKRLLVESVELLRTHGTAARLGAALHSLGDVLLDEKAFEEATAHYRESLQLAHELGSNRDTAYCLAGLASAAAGAGDPANAARLWGAVEAIETRIHVRLRETERRRYERALDRLDPELVEEGSKLTPDAALSLAIGPALRGVGVPGDAPASQPLRDRSSDAP